MLLTVLAVRPAPAQVLADTPENRHAQAQRYLLANPPRQLFAEMAKNLVANLPAAQRDKVTAIFTTDLDVDAVTRGMEDVLVKRFTAEELQGMADFYGSPVGKAVTSKMAAYSSDLIPLVQEQLRKGLAGDAPGK